MIALEIAAFIYALGYVGAIIFDRTRRKIDTVVHVQGQTEQAEHMDFCVTLFEGESDGIQQEKLNRAFLATEARRGYNNKRMQDEALRMQEQMKSEKLKLAEKKEG